MGCLLYCMLCTPLPLLHHPSHVVCIHRGGGYTSWYHGLGDVAVHAGKQLLLLYVLYSVLHLRRHP